MKTKWLATMLKGLWVGSTMTVPGVSGGTMAVVVGIYEDLIHGINEMKKNPKSQISFLLPFATGAGVGFLIFSRIVTIFLNSAATGNLTRLFFCGVVIGGVPLLVRKSGITKIGIRHLLSLFGGALVVFQMASFPQGLFSVGSGVTFWLLQIIAGLIVAMALVLPGISVTHILYIMGLYEVVLQKVYELDFLSLLPLAIGGILGIFLTADLLEKGMTKFTEEMYMAITGFVAASLFNLIPTEPMSVPFIGVMIFAVGFLGMYIITRKVEVLEPIEL